MNFKSINNTPGDARGQMLADVFGKVLAALTDSSKPTDEAILELAGSYGVHHCPKCGKLYTARPATSRRKAFGDICQDCGIMEALEDLRSAAAEAGKDIKAAMQQAAETMQQAADGITEKLKASGVTTQEAKQ